MASGRQHADWREPPPPNGGDPEQLLVQRILSSQCLERSARMRDFLAYVCDRARNEPQADIREQDIGCAVFSRPADYDTNQDNIVRVNASLLRRKLETYFALEGATEPLILELPKGQYRPVFHARSEPAALPETLVPPVRGTGVRTGGTSVSGSAAGSERAWNTGLYCPLGNSRISGSVAPSNAK